MDDRLINSIGLALDIIGVILVYRFGIASDVRPRASGTVIQFPPYPTETEQRETRARWKRYQRMALLGLLFLVIGLALQVASNYI